MVAEPPAPLKPGGMAPPHRYRSSRARTDDNLRMMCPPLEGATATEAKLGDRVLTTFGGCNYLGLAQHPQVIEAAVRGAARYGLSTSASRRTTGNTAEHDALERELAAFTGHEAGLLLLDGFTANIAAMQTLAPSIRGVVIDERAHRSLFDASKAAGLTVQTFRHLDPADAARAARAVGGPMAILTDGVFAADGAMAPVEALLDALPTPDSVLLVDDCHGFMVLGSNGSGTLSHLGIAPTPRIVVTTTLAKGLGCAGGVVLSTTPRIEGARSSASVFICTTPTPPPIVAAAREALRVNIREPQRRERLHANAARFAAVLNEAGLGPADPSTPIFAFTLADEPSMEALRDRLERAGVSVPLISYPGGPAPRYFRAAVTAEHTPAQIERLGQLLGVL